LLAHGFVVRATHCIAERLGLSSADVTLGPTSLSSSFHFVANLLPGLHGACQVGMMSKWNPEAAWDDMEQRRVSMVVGNPLLYADLLNICRHKGRKPSALRIALSGGAPVPPDLKRAFVDELGIFLVESYGQSELGGFVGMGFPRREPEERLFTIGPSLPDREVIIADEKDREVPIGEIGQMLIRDGEMLGYWNMPEKTADALKNGWLHTGDMGRMDSEGYITMVGRWSERIVCDGRIIFPRRIEEALLRHPSVRYACVIGRADKTHGELIKGLVELYPEKPAKEKELVEFCHSQLDAREVPAILEILEQMPMTPTGKIGRADLQKREKSLKG
jgi:acyl-CoA synthetase (AMP-forming)/AMP-acid ligase II